MGSWSVSAPKPFYQDELTTLYLGDAREVLPTLPDASIDLVLSDPPYPKKFQWCFDLLGEQSARLLKDTGSLISLCGHYQVPDVTRVVGEHLRFWWALGMGQTHRRRFPGVWVNIYWKPAFWWVKRTRRLDLISMLPNDFVKGSAPEKGHHEWQQAINWFEHYVENITQEGETILDPYAGSGTTLLAARNFGRKSIGIEVEEWACKEVVARITGKPVEAPQPKFHHTVRLAL